MGVGGRGKTHTRGKFNVEQEATFSVVRRRYLRSPLLMNVKNNTVLNSNNIKLCNAKFAYMCICARRVLRVARACNYIDVGQYTLSRRACTVRTIKYILPLGRRSLAARVEETTSYTLFEMYSRLTTYLKLYYYIYIYIKNITCVVIRTYLHIITRVYYYLYTGLYTPLPPYRA